MLVDEGRVEKLPEYSNDEYEMFEVEGGSDTYNIELETETGASICLCPHPYSCGKTAGSMCSHQLAVQLFKFEEMTGRKLTDQKEIIKDHDE